MYAYLKTIHIIFVVTWFAGLFYFPRLLIYDVEAREKSEPEQGVLVRQFRLMQKRLLFGITYPSMILTLILGFWLKCESPHIGWTDSWFIAKLCFVTGLIGYHLSLHKFYLDLGNNKLQVSSTFLRIWNEIATIFLIAIVFLVELQNMLSLLYGLLGLLGLILILLVAIRIYKGMRKSS
jgi:putative membrane protein